MRLIIFTTLSIISLILLTNSSYAQSFFDRQEQEKIGAVPSDKFINEKGELIGASLRVENKIIDQELIEKSYFDEKDRLVVKRYYDHYGVLYYDDDGIAIYEFDYDEIGNRIEVRYFDEMKHPFQINFVGPAAIKYKYDEKRRVTQVTYLDAAYKLNASMGIAMITYKYDEKGRLTEEKRLDEEKNPIDFFAPIIQYKYDNNDRVIEKSYRDAQGIITSRMMDDDDENEIAIIRFSYLDDKTIATVFRKDGTKLKY